MKSLLIALAAWLTPLDAQAQSVAAADSAFYASRWNDALALYEKVLAANGRNLAAHTKAGFAALALGESGVAESHFSQVIAGVPSGAPNAQAGMAIVRARRRDSNGAIEHLERAVGAGYLGLVVLDSEPAFKTLRGDARFVALRATVERALFPCARDSAARSFDFWVGDWEVYVNGSNQRVGTNRIEKVSEGCAILEHWTTWTTPLQPPQNGKSLNFIDPRTGRWRQVWMGSGRGQNNYENGEYTDNAMRFTYERTDGQGNPVRGRFTFFNLGPNRVRQFQEQTRDGQTYQTVYDFIYIRKGSGERP
jgi:hypothetical protein